MRRITSLVIAALLFQTGPGLSSQQGASQQGASQRVPGKQWMVYEDPAQAGFDTTKLEAAREAWEELPSSAFMVISGGAVVANWGDTQRRFMCHSVRKSFLSALFGIYWDRGEMDLNKTLFDLGIDDTPDPLLESERHARILDLLKARSGIFHPAAYAGRTDSAARGSKGAGRYFAYNNWDFNTLATILMQETGDDVFEAFDEHFGQPLAMQDWRISDGYYHYERDKSRYPAYPFRMSARDAARFGLLFAREGLWGDQRILSKQWVRRSSAVYSVDNEIHSYGFMWWVYNEPRFERYGMYSALGVGNQMIAVLPEIDLVIVNRANTYESEYTPSDQLRDLVAQVLEARTGSPVAQPNLAALADAPTPGLTQAPNEKLMEFVGRWDYPAKPLGLRLRTTVDLAVAPGHLVGTSPESGTFKLYLQPDGSLLEEDSHDRYYLIRDDAGAFGGLAARGAVVASALSFYADSNKKRGAELMALVENDEGLPTVVGRALVDLLTGKPQRTEEALKKIAEKAGPGPVEYRVNNTGYQFLRAGKQELARDVFALNTRLFPQSSNAWDSLGEAHMSLGNHEEAIRYYEKSLELNENNQNAVAMIAKMREGSEDG